MADEKAIKICINEMISSLEEELSCRDFGPRATVGKKSSYRIRLWSHDLGWKKETVQVHYPKIAPRLVYIQLLVDLPGSDDGDSTLDARGVDVILNRKDTFRIPTLFTGMRTRSFAQKVTEDTLKAFSWYENFSTPEKALARLVEGHTVNGLAQGKKIQDMKRYLESLVVSELESPS